WCFVPSPGAWPGLGRHDIDRAKDACESGRAACPHASTGPEPCNQGHRLTEAGRCQRRDPCISPPWRFAARCRVRAATPASTGSAATEPLAPFAARGQHRWMTDAPQQPDARLWLRLLLGGAMLGPGKAEILERIRDTGSISAAGRGMAMSYKRAWSLVEEMNAAF